MYVEQFSDLYGEEHVFCNVHSLILIHLVDDCRVYGRKVLDNFNAFTFENRFQAFKRRFKKKSYTLSQLYNRGFENRFAKYVNHPKVSKKTIVEFY